MRKTLPGDPTVDLILRRSARARRFSLRVSRLDGRVTLSMPVHAPLADALAFAEEQADWIRRTRARSAGAEPVAFGRTVPFEGRPLVVTPGVVRAARVEEDRLILPADPGRAAIRAMAFFKLQARQRLQAATDRHAASLGRGHAGIVLRDTRSRWGSCSHQGQIMYSWRLIMAPAPVLDYVAAHEVAHLAEMNHSAAFWSVVRGLMPDYERHRRWLKREGNLLHRYDFSGLAAEPGLV